MGGQKVWNVFLLNGVLMSVKCVPSVHQYAHLKMLIAAWSGYSANRMISINQASMLETLIKKAGHECIFLPKFHCELNPIEMVCEDYLVSLLTKSNTLFKYWGWVKYRYREVPKKNFTEAKDVTLRYLNACPAHVIRRFINRSWRFMSAYRKGLTGNAAAWAVRKQKQHCQVSNRVMMSIDAVLNPN